MAKFCEDCGTLLQNGRYCPKCGKLKNSKSDTTKQSSIPRNKKTDGIFPFRKIRHGQKQFMNDSKKTFKNNENLIAHAPTGIGKTAAVLTAAVKHSDEDDKIFFLTSKQSQHRIAIETIKKMPDKVTAIDVISKKHMCPRDESRLPYPVFEKFCSENGQNQCNLFNKQMSKIVDSLVGTTKHVNEIVNLCRSRGVCPHKAALVAGKEADIIVCDYNYVFDEIRESIFDLLDIELENAVVIVDEAHNLPDRIRSHLEESITVQILNETHQILQGYSSSLASFIKRLSMELEKIDEDEKKIDKKFLDQRIKQAMKGGLSQYESTKDILGNLENVARDVLEEDSAATAPMYVYSFLSAWQVEGEEVFRSFEKNPNRINVGLLDPSLLSEEVFNRISASVLMSGTMHPGEMYADLLGIRDKKIEVYESPFPDKNRKVVSVGHLTTSYKERGVRMFQAYANSIADVANNTPGNTAVFFPSYNLMESICDRLNMVHLEKNIMMEDRNYTKREKDEMVDELKKSEDNILLAVQGGSLSEGVDYANNILSSVIIVGIPFPPPSIEVESLQKYYSKKFGEQKGYLYSRVYPALNRVLQAAGRCIRSKSDKGFIVLMDKRFNYSRYKDSMPDDFEYKKTDNLVRECKRFFD